MADPGEARYISLFIRGPGTEHLIGVGGAVLTDKRITTLLLQQSPYKAPLLKDSRFTGGGSPNLAVLVEWKVPIEWKVPVEWKVVAAEISIPFTHNSTLALYTQLI